MNRERAEAHLRLLAEEEPRRATMLVPDATAGSPPEQAMRRASVTGTLAGSAACPMRSWHQAGRGAPVARAPGFTRCITERWCAWLHSLCGTPGPPSRWCRTRVRRAAPRRASAGGHPRGTGLSAAGCGEPVTSGPASPVSSGPPLARDLPEPWLSMLARYLDGITLAILGLHNCQGRTVMHMHASGPMCQLSGHSDDPWSDHPDELYCWPVMWIRDSGGRWLWHTTRIRSRSGMNDQVALRLEVIPPLSCASAWIEVLAAGHSAQARATLPLRWQ